MEELIIENNIPVPTKKRFDWITPLDKLVFEDSFSFDKSKRQNIANCVSNHFKRFTNKRFHIANDPEDTTGTKCRVWRIQDANDNS